MLTRFNQLKPNCQTQNCQPVIFLFTAKLSHGQLCSCMVKMLVTKTLAVKFLDSLRHSTPKDYGLIGYGFLVTVLLSLGVGINKLFGFLFM